MSFFQDNYTNLSLPFPGDETTGLRRPQHGALHSIAGHFTNRQEQAIVSMPTGSGKTAVLMLTPFFLQAKRVLVLTPSRLVRNQIFEDFSKLKTLRKVGCFDEAVTNPEVIEVENKLANTTDWEALESFDVVVATPLCVSPAIDGIADPPTDFFDLILVDEAHHVAAKTWNDALSAFPNARKVLFTATPFRRDRREIPGRFVYSFSLKDAHADKIFGKINFVAVTPNTNELSDVAIAKRAEEQFNQDRAVGLDHVVMVRTDTKTRARELKAIYAEHTGLRLRVVHSGHTLRHIKSSIGKLKEAELDGIICVDMLGEGFDFPNLKIAAIHSPHKSLAVTLQFIGRFARTAGENIGDAKFIAVPSEIEIESQKLYDDSVIWQELISDLSQTRIDAEHEIRESLDTFESPIVTDFSTEDLSLYSLKPSSHVKIFRVNDFNLDKTRSLDLGGGLSTIYSQNSPENSAAIVIVREKTKPRWASIEAFCDVQHELFLIYYDQESGLLFINASRKAESLYDRIAKHYCGEPFSGLQLSKVNRVLRDLDNLSCFNIGMKNRVQANNTESYRILAGSKADAAVTESDGSLYDRGHVFAKGDTGENSQTIGYSSLSKVWSSKPLQIPESINWCKSVARKITSTAPVNTGSGLDHLAVGKDLQVIPGNVITADWHEDTYKSSPQITYIDFAGHQQMISLLDLDLVIDIESTDEAGVGVSLTGLSFQYDLRFQLAPRPQFIEIETTAERLPHVVSREQVPLVEYLNENLLSFFCADLSRFQGNQLFSSNLESRIPFDTNRISVVDWNNHNVDIEREYGDTNGQSQSIHDFLKVQLNQERFSAVIYDHRSGEIADFITFCETESSISVELYHCKGSGGPLPGNRIGDLYEVCGQAVKSVKFTFNNGQLYEKIAHRTATGSVFIRGDIEVVEQLLDDQTKPIVFKYVLVQPGVSQQDLSLQSGLLLASTAEYVRRTRSEEVFVWGSA